MASGYACGVSARISTPANPASLIARMASTTGWRVKALVEKASFMRRESLREVVPQSTGSFHFVLQLLVNLVDADLRRGTGGEAAIGVEGDALRGQILQRFLHAAVDLFGAVDHAGLRADAAESDFEILA